MTDIHTIASRDADGVVTTAETTFQIPTDRGMLNVIGSNTTFPNNSTFREDGWIVDQHGARIKKWYDGVWSDRLGDKVRVWPPRLNGPVALEARCWKVRQAVNRYNDKVVQPAFDACRDAGGGHVNIPHEYSGELPPWWLYKVGDYGLFFDWVAEPKHPINQTLATRYYQATRGQRVMWRRLAAFEAAFTRAYERRLSDLPPPTRDGQQLALTINRRIYWFAPKRTKYGQIIWSKLSFPEDEITNITWEADDE